MMFRSIGRAPASFRSLHISIKLNTTPAFNMSPAIKRQASTKPLLPASEGKGLSGYNQNSSKGPMLKFEDTLPRLPVPTLEETCARYLKTLQPLLSNEEYAASEKAVKAFNQPGSLGTKLQERLTARAQDPEVKNWISEWWDRAAYLSVRDPVIPYASYFYSFRDDRYRRNPAKRAAALTTAALEFKRQYDTGSLEPDYMRKRPISMNSYQYMFNTSRVPAIPADYPIQYPAESNEHIVAIRNNQMFKIPTHPAGKQLNASELEVQFNKVYRYAQPTDAIGAITSLPRDQAAKARENLLTASPLNAASLKEIEAASFVVCLDSSFPVTLEERAHVYWHGDGTNRWYDKPTAFIVNDNGTAGFLGEHSMMDGTATHRLCETVNASIINNTLDFENPRVRSDLSDPAAIQFQTSPKVLEDIASAKAQFSQAITSHDLRVQVYQGYGKGLIKKMKCSPDAYVQMVIQLAYHKMYGKNRPTYESATTRKYLQGRTEATRSVSQQSVDFCNAMADPLTSREEAERLFRAAVRAHAQYVADASEGHGVDRHLFGLRKMIQDGEELPELFADPAYTYSSTWYISSSQISSETFNGYGWSQVIDQGWGIAYMINENSLQFNVVSKRLGCERMSFFLSEAANEVRDLLLPSLEPPKAKL